MFPLLLLLALFASPLAAQPPAPALTRQAATQPDTTAPSTREMGALLRRIFSEQDWKTDPNKQSERAAYYRAVLTKPLDLPTEITIRQALANELLGAGDSAAAVTTLTSVLATVAERHAPIPPATLRELHSLLGLAYLRLGEQQNCLAHHSTRSCIFPIDAGGMHHRPEGAEGAVREFSAVLALDPADTSARWLLNLAYMQLGEYPAQVPAQWLIPATLFRSEYPLHTFDEVATEAGVGITSHAGGAVLEDFDGDGLLDLAVTSSGPLDQMHLFKNRGDGTFEDVTRQAGLTGELGGLNLICADYDNDGHPDLLVLRGGWWAAHGAYPFSLLHNRGDGSFEDVTVKAGLLSLHPTQTAAFADFDNDGWLDLWVPHESTPGDLHPSQLFRNNHDGTFTDIAQASGLADLGFVKGTAWGDYNNDGRPDLYVSIKGAPNRLFRNDGPAPGDDPAHPTRWRFTDVTASARVAEPVESFTTWFFDYDNDGWPDLFVAGYSSTPKEIGAFEAGLPSKAETPRLYHNQHDGTFRDVTREMHLDRAILTMGASFGDLDNDGWLDVYLGTGDSLYTSLLPNRMFRNDGGHRFQDVTTAGGFGHLQKGHSIAFGDIDNDGDEDIFEEMGGALPGDSYQSVLYRNPGTPGTHWLSLTLTGVRSNRSAIGAVIHVTVTGTLPGTVAGTHGARHIYRTVGYGSSFGGNPLRQHIGLGTSAGLVTVEVRWPTSGTTQTFSVPAVDRAYGITEGRQELEPLHYPQFKLPDPAMPSAATHQAGP